MVGSAAGGASVSEKSIIIIGAGMAGLSAGCYGRMNGFRTTIFEMHAKKPGGLCTSWNRKGFTVNGCLHWLVGSGQGSNFHDLWLELGALQGKTIVNYEEYLRLETVDGRQFIAATDIDQLEKNMKEIATEDHKLIEEFIGAIRICTRFDPVGPKAPELMGLLDMIIMVIRNARLLPVLAKWNKISLKEYGERFKSPVLRDAFGLLFIADMSVTFMLMNFAWMHKKTAGYPVGGSLRFSEAIEQRYLSLGGGINYKTKVNRILTENGKAVGIRCDDGKEHRADYVISAADGHATIFEMLEGKYVDRTIKGYYEKMTPFPPIVYVALGVNRTFPEFKASAGGIAIGLKEPLVIGNVRHSYLDVHIYNFDPTLAPEGKTLLVAILPTDYEHWHALRKDGERYKAEKEKIGKSVVSVLDKRFPGLQHQVEMQDIASPTTFVRYTGNWQGSFEGWQVTPATWKFGSVMKRMLPGLANFYMAGQWVEPGGGLPNSAVSGRYVIQMICHKEKKKFSTGK